MTLHFYWAYLETQKGPNYWYERSIFVWCLLRQRNGGWNSGQKPATIVTDAFLKNVTEIDTVARESTDPHVEPQVQILFHIEGEGQGCTWYNDKWQHDKHGPILKSLNILNKMH